MTERPKSPRTDGTTLKDLAKHLGLTKGTVSAVLNDSPYAKAIPQHTKNRIFAAAQAMNYQPNFFARTLRKKRTNTVGVPMSGPSPWMVGPKISLMRISLIRDTRPRSSAFPRRARM